MRLLDGILASNKLAEKLKKDIQASLPLKLCVILLGHNPSSEIYVHRKQKTCSELGIACEILRPDPKTTLELTHLIKTLNNDDTVNGILVQLPLPSYIQTREVLDNVEITKDVDGLHSYHLMKILLNEEKIVPCTPKGILSLLSHYAISLEGKNVCVIGFSDVVGKPLATLCLNRGATVTVCHKKTKNLAQHTKTADIVMTATGAPKLLTKEMIKDHAVVVDIGISNVEGKIVGDADFEDIKEKCSYLTPVPGGVGPMTVISLVENLVHLKEQQRQRAKKSGTPKIVAE